MSFSNFLNHNTGNISLWTLGLIIMVSFLGTVLFVKMTEDDTTISASNWRGGEAQGNYQTLETKAMTADGVMIMVETWHDLRIDPDKWDLPTVVKIAVGATTLTFMIDSITNHHAEFTTQILQFAQWFVGDTNLRIVVNAIEKEQND